MTDNGALAAVSIATGDPSLFNTPDQRGYSAPDLGLDEDMPSNRPSSTRNDVLLDRRKRWRNAPSHLLNTRADDTIWFLQL